MELVDFCEVKVHSVFGVCSDFIIWFTLDKKHIRKCDQKCLFKTFLRTFKFHLFSSFSVLNFLNLGLLAILPLNCFPFPDSSRSFFSPTVTYFYYFLFPLVLFTVLFSISLFHTLYFFFLPHTLVFSLMCNVLKCILFYFFYNFLCTLLLPVIFNSLELCRIQVVLLSFVFHHYRNIISQ